MANTRITLDAIEALEKLGVGDAVNEVGALLRDGDGLGKHGEQGWRDLTREELCDKIKRHNPGLAGFMSYDNDSKRSAWAHLAVRALMALQVVLQRVRRGLSAGF